MAILLWVGPSLLISTNQHGWSPPIKQHPSGNPNSWIQKAVENKWIQSISHTKSHESHWKTNGFKAFLLLQVNLMNPIPNLMNPILFFLPIIWGLLGGGGLSIRSWHYVVNIAETSCDIPTCTDMLGTWCLYTFHFCP